MDLRVNKNLYLNINALYIYLKPLHNNYNTKYTTPFIRFLMVLYMKFIGDFKKTHNV